MQQCRDRGSVLRAEKSLEVERAVDENRLQNQQPAERNDEGAAEAVNIGSSEPEVMWKGCAEVGFFGGCVAQREMWSSSEVGSVKAGQDGRGGARSGR